MILLAVRAPGPAAPPRRLAPSAADSDRAPPAPRAPQVDLYPMIYKGKGSDLWNNQVPMLSFAQDAPGLALDYRLPAIRVAFQVIK